MFPKINKSLNSSGVISSEFTIKSANKIQDFTLEKYVREKINKYIGKYVNILEFFNTNKLFQSISSGNITIASFISAIGTLVELITAFITILFTLSNGFVKLF